jgi:hypothetical protein
MCHFEWAPMTKWWTARVGSVSSVIMSNYDMSYQLKSVFFRINCQCRNRVPTYIKKSLTFGPVLSVSP